MNLDSIQIHLNSKYADKYVNGSVSDCEFNLPHGFFFAPGRAFPPIFLVQPPHRNPTARRKWFLVLIMLFQNHEWLLQWEICINYRFRLQKKSIGKIKRELRFPTYSILLFLQFEQPNVYKGFKKVNIRSISSRWWYGTHAWKYWWKTYLMVNWLVCRQLSQPMSLNVQNTQLWQRISLQPRGQWSGTPAPYYSLTCPKLTE